MANELIASAVTITSSSPITGAPDVSLSIVIEIANKVIREGAVYLEIPKRNVKNKELSQSYPDSFWQNDDSEITARYGDKEGLEDVVESTCEIYQYVKGFPTADYDTMVLFLNNENDIPATYLLTIIIPECKNAPSTEPVDGWRIKTGVVESVGIVVQFYETDYINEGMLTIS